VHNCDRKTEGKISLGKPWRGCENIIKIVLKEIGWEGVDWIQLVQDGV
jgi:hypothetical protein